MAKPLVSCNLLWWIWKLYQTFLNLCAMMIINKICIDIVEIIKICILPSPLNMQHYSRPPLVIWWFPLLYIKHCMNVLLLAKECNIQEGKSMKYIKIFHFHRCALVGVLAWYNFSYILWFPLMFIILFGFQYLKDHYLCILGVKHSRNELKGEGKIYRSCIIVILR